MKKEYDFLKGERGKFYHPDARVNLPIYLDPDIAEFFHDYVKNKNENTGKIVNEWLRNNIKLIRSIM